MAPKRKRTLAGPLPSCAIAGLLVVSAPAARIARRCAEFVVRTQGVALLRLARTAELGPVVHALVAMLHRQRGGGDGAVDHGHCAFAKASPLKVPPVGMVAASARMLPTNCESVIVAAAPVH